MYLVDEEDKKFLVKSKCNKSKSLVFVFKQDEYGNTEAIGIFSSATEAGNYAKKIRDRFKKG